MINIWLVLFIVLSPIHVRFSFLLLFHPSLGFLFSSHVLVMTIFGATVAGWRITSSSASSRALQIFSSPTFVPFLSEHPINIAFYLSDIHHVVLFLFGELEVHRNVSELRHYVSNRNLNRNIGVLRHSMHYLLLNLSAFNPNNRKFFSNGILSVNRPCPLVLQLHVLVGNSRVLSSLISDSPSRHCHLFLGGVLLDFFR